MLQPLTDLERWSTATPESIALAMPHRSYTFAQLRAAADAVASRLRERGVSRGDLVCVDLPSGLEWIVDLALFRLAAQSVSLRAVNGTGALAPDVLVTESGRPAIDGAVAIHVDEPWIDGAVAACGGPRASAAIEDVDFDDNAIFRLILTSGTTGGVPKVAAYSAGAFVHRMADGHLHWTDGRPELTLIGLSTTGGFHAAAACIQLGIPYLAVDRIDASTMSFAAQQHIEVLCGSPTQVAMAIHVMREAGIGLPQLREVRLAGAGPTESLLGLIADTLGEGIAVRGVYGSTEGGGISQVWYAPGVDRYAVGTPLPGVELQIVSPAGAPVAAGVEGAIRYRTRGLVSGYVVEGKVEPFADGWFVPGDLGTLGEDGSLTLGGRESEIFNIGGLKVDPLLIDEFAAAFPGVTDAAAFSLERRAGLAEVGLAVVCKPNCDLRMLDSKLRELLPLGHPTAYWRVAEIPRTRLGKVMRASLIEAYATRPRS